MSKNKIKYSIIDCDNPDFSKVLELRLKAYLASNRFEHPPTDPSVMGDEFDQFSEIVIGKDGDKVISSLRGTIYPAGIDTEDSPYMKNPPKSEDCMGFSKFCVDPDYRGTTTSIDTFSFSGDITIKYRRKYIIGGGFEDIVRFYEKVGVKKTGDIALIDKFGKPTYVVLGDARNIVIGKDVGIVYWSLLYSRAAVNCVFGNAYHIDRITKFKILIKLLFVPIARTLFYYKVWKHKFLSKSKRNK